jgi:cobalamin biosynthetic protein CobC
MDVGPREESVTGDVASGGLVVLRSFGKFFGLAGVRLGFAIAAEEIAAKLDAELGPWAVSGQALEYRRRGAFRRGLAERNARSSRAGSRACRDAFLAIWSWNVSGGTSLFSFFRTEKAPKLFEFLGKNGVILRKFRRQAE